MLRVHLNAKKQPFIAERLALISRLGGNIILWLL